MSSDLINILTYCSIIIGNTLYFFYFRNRMARMEKEVRNVRLWQEKRDSKDVKIFVLDDDEDDLSFIEKIVQRTGNKYEMFNVWEELVNKVPDGKNVFIIDHFLVGADGLRILEKLKEKNDGNFVISFTGSQSDKVISDYIIAGVDRFVYKNNPDWEKMLEKAINDGIVVVLN